MFKRYGSGIVDIIFAVASGKEAVEKCEKRDESEIRSLLTELLCEDDGGTDVSGNDDIESMVARLAARFGVTDDEQSPGEEDTEDPVDIVD
jgi:hypothetical protein